VLARALVFARTKTASYRTSVIKSCMAAINTKYTRTLALGRELAAYVVSADLVGLPDTENTKFKTWIKAVINKTLSDGRTLITMSEKRGGCNWGGMGMCSRLAVHKYLGDQAGIDRCVKVFKGVLGDRSSFTGIVYGDLAWQYDKTKPVGINAKGATRSGRNIDGVIPDDQRRSGGFTWPPPRENYCWENLQGIVGTAIMLDRSGYDVWSWSDQAILRAVKWLYNICKFPAVGDDVNTPYVINYFYKTTFSTVRPTRPGKNLGFYDWLFGS